MGFFVGAKTVWLEPVLSIPMGNAKALLVAIH